MTAGIIRTRKKTFAVRTLFYPQVDLWDIDKGKHQASSITGMESLKFPLFFTIPLSTFFIPYLSLLSLGIFLKSSSIFPMYLSSITCVGHVFPYNHIDPPHHLFTHLMVPAFQTSLFTFKTCHSIPNTFRKFSRHDMSWFLKEFKMMCIFLLGFCVPFYVSMHQGLYFMVIFQLPQEETAQKLNFAVRTTDASATPSDATVRMTVKTIRMRMAAVSWVFTWRSAPGNNQTLHIFYLFTSYILLPCWGLPMYKWSMHWQWHAVRWLQGLWRCQRWNELPYQVSRWKMVLEWPVHL